MAYKTIVLDPKYRYYDEYRETYHWYPDTGEFINRWYNRTNYDRLGVQYGQESYSEYSAYTYYKSFVFDESKFESSSPESADDEKIDLSIKITADHQVNIPMICAVYAAGRPLNTAKNAFIAFYTEGILLGVIPKGNNGNFNVTITNRDTLDKIKKFGIVVAPAQVASVNDDATDRVNVMLDFKKFTVKLTRYYQNSATPGQITNIKPNPHSVLIANRDNVITYKYTQKYDFPLAYLGIKISSLETGAVTEVKKKVVSPPVPSGGTGAYTIPAGTLTDGTYQLDISGMPEASATHYPDDSPEWLSGAATEYTIKTTPEASTIFCDGKPVPTITWHSVGQAAFRVKFGSYDSGVIIGSANSYKIPMIFPDGNYPVLIRVATNVGEWSAWTDVDYATIKNTPVDGSLSLTVDQFGGNSRLAWISSVTPDNYAVFRGEKLIAVTSGTTYVDRFSAGDAEYHVLAMVGDNYVSSDTVLFALTLPADLISTDDGLTYTALKYTPNRKSQDVEKSTAETMVYYAGREKPIAISSGRKNRVRNCAYIFKTRTEADKIAEMEGLLVLLKTTRGYIIYGIMQELVHTDAKCPILTFKIREIDRGGDYVQYHV